MPMLSATDKASLRSSSMVHSLSSAKSTQFFINRPSTSKPCCLSNKAATEESTPPDRPTTTFLCSDIINQLINQVDNVYRKDSLADIAQLMDCGTVSSDAESLLHPAKPPGEYQNPEADPVVHRAFR